MVLFRKVLMFALDWVISALGKETREGVSQSIVEGARRDFARAVDRVAIDDIRRDLERQKRKWSRSGLIGPFDQDT
jgi:hypothetical protein